MPVPVKPVAQKTTDNQQISNDIETMQQKYPPLIGWSVSAAAGVTGNNGQSGPGVAGINSKNGVGVYGKSSGNAGSFDGNVQVNGNITCTGDVVLSGADCAELFDCSDSQSIEPGTLLIADSNGALKPCDQGYDSRVVGIVAGAGSYRPAIILDKTQSASPRVAVSLMGKAFCKADAQFGAIRTGDLLTSSSTPGHAMKASDKDRSFGTVVGKALRSLDEGTGLIPVLVSLH